MDFKIMESDTHIVLATSVKGYLSNGKRFLIAPQKKI
jgi:hypothetical protein